MFASFALKVVRNTSRPCRYPSAVFAYLESKLLRSNSALMLGFILFSRRRLKTPHMKLTSLMFACWLRVGVVKGDGHGAPGSLCLFTRLVLLDGVEWDMLALLEGALFGVLRPVCGVWSPLALPATCSVHGCVRLVVGVAKSVVFFGLLGISGRI